MKILLVEDNVKLSKSIKQGLEQEGFAVDCLFDGLLAESRLKMSSDEYDVVILDRMLPGKDGVLVCKSVRDSAVTVPIIMLTALDTTGDKVEGLDSGADDYLAKPFEFSELVARLHALLRRPKNLAPDKVELGDIELDTTNKIVKYKGKEITLTLKEFMVLEYLIKNRGKVISRDTLYSHAWDFADSSFSNTVDVHIKNLRKKLKDNGKIIQTVRGLGYKIQ